jgi:hypothetical protein
MALIISLESPDTGAVAAYHRIVHVATDFIGGISTVTVQGYVSEGTRRAGRQALSTDQVQVYGLPPEEATDLRAWLYERLAEPADEGAAVASPAVGMLAPTAAANRHKWAGAGRA